MAVQSVRVFCDPNPGFARIIVPDDWSGNSRDVTAAMKLVADNWPEEVEKVYAILTPAGFLAAALPRACEKLLPGSSGSVEEARETTQDLWEAIEEHARTKIVRIIPVSVMGQLMAVSDFLVFGIDMSNAQKEYILDLAVTVPAGLDDLYLTTSTVPPDGRDGSLISLVPQFHFFPTKPGRKKPAQHCVLVGDDIRAFVGDVDPSGYTQEIWAEIETLLRESGRSASTRILSCGRSLDGLEMRAQEGAVQSETLVIATGRFPEGDRFSYAAMRRQLAKSKLAPTLDFFIS